MRSLGILTTDLAAVSKFRVEHPDVGMDLYWDIRTAAMQDMEALGEMAGILEAKSRFLSHHSGILVEAFPESFECLQLTTGALLRLISGELRYLELVDSTRAISSALLPMGAEDERAALDRARETGRLRVSMRVDVDAFAKRAADASG